MGEYATYNGKSIKLGTCESMYYLRADQRHLIDGYSFDGQQVSLLPLPDTEIPTGDEPQAVDELEPRRGCEWFALCENDAAGVVWHPVLDDVPTCERCAVRLELELRRY